MFGTSLEMNAWRSYTGTTTQYTRNNKRYVELERKAGAYTGDSERNVADVDVHAIKILRI